MSESEETHVSLGDLVRPLGARIVVLVDTKSEVTKAGLYIPVETARSIHEEKPTQGTVLVLGPDVDEDDDINVGDVVLFGKYTGTRIKWQPPKEEGKPMRDAETVIVMESKAVLAVLLSPEQAKNLKVRG